VRRRSCRHSKSDTCKERGCRAKKVEARHNDSHERDEDCAVQGCKRGVRSSGKS
jgi:hypothetical protein